LLDLLYAQAAATRRRWYERHPEARRRLRRPVISVGNLSVGGTGKTPLVATIAQWLLDRGERPAVLSRGYGRRVHDVGAVVVSDGKAILTDLDHAGDEPLMLARALGDARVVVAEDRHLAGVLAERRLGATVHVLDDGFQHFRLARDLDVLVTMPGEITGGRALPIGRLREHPDAAARADIVVVLGADAATARSEAWALGVSQSCGAQRRVGTPAVSARLAEARGSLLPRAEPGAVIAVAGIGNPSQFFAGLRDAGVDVRATKAFADHHRYTVADVRAIADAARAAGVERVITTPKDAVRLEPLGVLPFTLSVATLTLALDPRDTLFACVEAALVRARTAA
jgi:tetraacyldisaccharide 4'-kinase